MIEVPLVKTQQACKTSKAGVKPRPKPLHRRPLLPSWAHLPLRLRQLANSVWASSRNGMQTLPLRRLHRLQTWAPLCWSTRLSLATHWELWGSTPLGQGTSTSKRGKRQGHIACWCGCAPPAAVPRALGEGWVSCRCVSCSHRCAASGHS